MWNDIVECSLWISNTPKFCHPGEGRGKLSKKHGRSFEPNLISHFQKAYTTILVATKKLFHRHGSTAYSCWGSSLLFYFLVYYVLYYSVYECTLDIFRLSSACIIIHSYRLRMYRRLILDTKSGIFKSKHVLLLITYVCLTDILIFIPWLRTFMYVNIIIIDAIVFNWG
jgi:hypothetical protein